MYSTPFDARSLRPAIVVAVLAALAAALFAVLPNLMASAAPVPVAKITKTTQQSSYGIWSDSVVPDVLNADEANSVTLGLDFSSSTNGLLYGIQYYAAGANRVATTGHLWNSRGKKIASVRLPTTSENGWKTAWFSSPVRIRAGVKYTASYRAPVGRYSTEEGVFSDRRNLTANGLTAHRGTYAYGTGRPTNTWHGSHYFVDVAFVPTSGSTPTPTPEPTPTPTPTPTTEPTTTPTTEPTTTPTTEPTTTPTQTQPAGCVKPDASNTGHTGTLTDYTGSTYITTPGTVIENKTVNGDLTIAAANVTIRNSRVTGLVRIARSGTDALVSHVSAEGGVAVSSAHRAVIEYTELGNAGGDDSLHVTSDDGVFIDGVTIRNNWINGLVMAEGAHYDGLQVRGAKNVLVECNNFDLGAWQFEYNAVVYFEWDNGGFSNVRVVNNWLLGGAFNVMISAADSDTNRIILNDNKVGGDYHWDLCYAEGAMAKPKEQTGNTSLNGDPVVPCP